MARQSEQNVVSFVVDPLVLHALNQQAERDERVTETELSSIKRAHGNATTVAPAVCAIHSAASSVLTRLVTDRQVLDSEIVAAKKRVRVIAAYVRAPKFEAVFKSDNLKVLYANLLELLDTFTERCKTATARNNQNSVDANKRNRDDNSSASSNTKPNETNTSMNGGSDARRASEATAVAESSSVATTNTTDAPVDRTQAIAPRATATRTSKRLAAAKRHDDDDNDKRQRVE